MSLEGTRGESSKETAPWNGDPFVVGWRAAKEKRGGRSIKYGRGRLCERPQPGRAEVTPLELND